MDNHENWFINEIQPDSIYGLSNDTLARAILVPKDLSNLTQTEIDSHNGYVLSSMKELIANDNSSYNTKEEGKMQIRLFYVAILSVLVSFLLNKKSISKASPIFILIIVILTMYGFEIHNHDTDKRSLAAKFVKVKAYEFLLNEYPTKVKYDLDLDTLNSAMINPTKHSLIRKIESAFTLDMERIIFYLVPFLLILYYDITNGRDTRDKSPHRLKYFHKHIIIPWESRIRRYTKKR